MSTLANNNQIPEQEAAFEVDIVDAQNNALVKIHSQPGYWQDLAQQDSQTELDPSSISLFNHWLSSVPTVATAIAGNATQLMTCSFEYSQLVQAKDGSGAIGAVLNPDTNKIGAQARFHEAENLKSLVNASLVFNIASQLLAQKHLADINERLRIIEQKIDSIKGHLEQSRLANIQTFHEHLNIIGLLLSRNEIITKESLLNLAKSAQEVRSQVKHLEKDITQAYREIEQFEPTSWFGSDDLREALKLKISNVERLQREYLTGMQCLLVANLILFIKHDGNQEFVLISELYLKELNASNGIFQQWEKIKRKVAHHLSKMKPLFERTSSTQANALQVERKLNQTDSLLNTDNVLLTQLGERIQAAQSPQVLLEIVDNKVLRGRFLR
ncbi:hypothetical protein [Citrobacter youngae]|uniref:hypothetical protein n=1 Tax=Citrobacter youngae TaxID=133448 RepID=UPI00397E17DD